MTKPAADERVLIVGAGQAAGELAASLRAGGYDGHVTLVGTEPHLPYSRPPLSKAFLRGEAQAEELFLRSEEFYREHAISVLRGVTVDWVDVNTKSVGCDDGSTLEWDKLVFATGGRPRRISDPELEAALNVHYVRTIDDVSRLRSLSLPGSKFAVLGGGYVGLEVTAVLRRLGAKVTVIEAADRLLARVTSPIVSEFFQRVHTEEGVDVRVATQVTGYEYNDGDVSAVRLADGSIVEVDQVLIGIGMLPNDDLAQAAGLQVENGIVVDEFCRSSAHGVYAIGDVSRHPDSQNGGLRRLESMPNATAQARHVASAILGTHEPYVDIPWFWSDQYEVKMQCAGLKSEFADVVVRGDPTEGRRFTVFYLKDDRVCAVDAVGSPSDFAVGKSLIASGAVVSAEVLADITVPLRSARRSRSVTS